MNYFEKQELKHTLAAQQRAAKLHRYKANRKDLGDLSIAHEGILGGHFQEIHKKQTVTLLQDNELDILTNQNLNHDTSILWHTQADFVRRALRYGQLKPQALTSKAIKAIGKYNKKCLDRKIKSRIESTLKTHKDSLTDMAQSRIENLQDLERLLGRRVHEDDAALAFEKLMKRLDEYDGKRRMEFTGYNAYEVHFAGWETYQQGFLAEGKVAVAALKEKLTRHKNDAAWLQTTGYAEILLFIKNQILDTLRQTQGLNQILTHERGSGAYLRGDLNSYIEDAVKVTRDHAQNLHNPVKRNHQLTYQPGDRVRIDSDDHTDGSVEDLEDFLLVVSELSGNNKPLEKIKGTITPTSATKWKHFRSFYEGSNPYKPSLFSSAEHFFGTIWNYLLGPFNLIETMFLGNSAGWVASCNYKPKEQDLTNKIDYYALTARVKEHTNFSTKVGLTIHKTFSYLIWEGLVMGVYDGIKQISRLPTDLFTDFHNQDASQLDKLLAELHAEVTQIKGAHWPAEDKEAVAKDKSVHYAQAKIPLTPYHSHGILNSSIDGVTGFIDLFGHNMFAKHPFTGAVSSAGAAASFLAFFAAPTAVSLMGKGYVKFLLDQGYIWTKDVVSASLAGSFTNFKLMGAILEGIEHGPDSWLSKGVSYVVKDPATAITYTTLSWMMGYAMVNLVNIPGLSEELKAHIGDPPALTEIFGGAKIGILGYHLLASPHESSETLRKNYANDCVKLYIKMQKQNGVTVTKEEEEKFRASIESLISSEKMKKIQDDIAQKVSSQEKNKLALMLTMATYKEQLAYVSPLLKAKLQHQLPQLTGSKEDANAVEQLLDPDKYAQRSTLRSFIGRIIGYIPVFVRCALSPLAAICAWSLASALRPWKELGAMVLDDVTSTVHAVLNLTHKILETIFNRLLRTVADIVVNGIIARVASFFGYHQLTIQGYKASAAWDIAQEKLYNNTTGLLLSSLTRANTTPHPEVGLKNGVKARMTASFGGGSLFRKDKGSAKQEEPNPLFNFNPSVS